MLETVIQCTSYL